MPSFESSDFSFFESDAPDDLAGTVAVWAGEGGGGGGTGDPRTKMAGKVGGGGRLLMEKEEELNHTKRGEFVGRDRALASSDPCVDPPRLSLVQSAACVSV